MSSLYISLDENSLGNVLIKGIFPSLKSLKTNCTEYTEICKTDLDNLDSGIYIKDNVLNISYTSIYD